VFWPITLDAIGEPSALQVRTVGSAGFGRFSSFAQLYDIQFDVTAEQDMVLPAGSGSELRYAQGLAESGSSGTAAPTTATPTTATPSAANPPASTSPAVTVTPTP